MRVYLFDLDVAHYRSLFVEIGGVEKHQAFDGRHTMAAGWISPEAAEISDNDLLEEERGLPLGDFADACSVAPLMSRRAVEGLADLLEGRCELLPVRHTPPMWLLNVLEVRDALDPRSSKVEYSSKRERRAMAIDRYRFHEGRLAGATIFKIPELMFEIFVTDAVAERIEKLGLTGGRLIEVGTGEPVPLPF